MHESPLVSVVMSIYNDGVFIRDAISSILDQSLRDFEFIIIDDGAIDDSVAQVETFNDHRIRLIRQTNQGLAKALNRGIHEARGKYIARQDGDDISDPYRLETQVAFLEEHPAVGLVGCNALVIDEGGHPLIPTNFPTDNASLQEWLLSKSSQNPFIHGSVLFHKAIAMDVGLYRPEFKRAQDVDLWLRIAERAELANLEDIAYRWRLRRTSVGGSSKTSQHDYARLAKVCARRRRAGQPEPDLSLSQVQRKFTGKLNYALRASSPDAEYELTLAKMLLGFGEKLAGQKHLLRAIREDPFNIYAWLLLGLSAFPGNMTNLLWNGVRSLYHRTIWKMG